LRQAQVAEATRKLLATMWERNLPLVRERVDELERAAAAASTGELTAEAKNSAIGTAHKLAGSLGTFGYHHGTDIAREMEQMLEVGSEPDAKRLVELAAGLRKELHL
jgi:HPt (histidine-containing phosphotransfer) domain-containing protein